MTYSLQQIQDLLNDPRPATTEALAQEAARLTRQYFGRTIGLYAPIYISNYCSSQCVYCGFHSHNRIHRQKLTPAEIDSEMKKISEMGIESILILTGESYEMTPVEYLEDAVRTAQRYFPSIALEIHPLDTDNYRRLFRAGADGVTLYQETYDRRRYAEVHLAGRKRDYDYRYEAPVRIAEAGFRQISLGVLLGLADIAEDLHALFRYLRMMEQRFPAVEYSLSFPRLREIKGRAFTPSTVDDTTFIRIICLARTAFPRIGINLSTREPAALRDHALELGVTRISAGSNTAVGGYDLAPTDEQEPQFDVMDHRSLQDIIALLKRRRFDPVLSDWRSISNE